MDDLTVALGPTGANKNGALSDLLETTAKNFGGEGAQFHQTIQDFSKLSATLDDNKDELFGSAAKLEGFIGTLAKNDKTVRQFNQSLADVSSMLSGERQELAASLKNLAEAMGQVSCFVKDNREILGRNITGLNRVAKVLVHQRAALDEVLKDAPVALNNLALTYNPQAGTLDTRANQGEVGNQIAADPAAFLCSIVDQADTSGKRATLIKQALPRTGTFGQGPRAAAAETSTTRPWVDSWRHSDEAAQARCWPLVAGSLAAQRLRLRRLQAAAARRHRRGRQPDHRARDVPRRARPGAQVDGQGQRRQRRPGHRHRARRLHRRRDAPDARATPSSPTTRSPRSARPACWARSSSRSSRRPRAPAATRSRPAT